MHKINSILIILLLLFSVFQASAQIENDNNYSMTSITPKGDQAPEENFTGTVWVNMVVSQNDGLNSVAGKVTFEPKARSNWHIHPGGQVLIVTDGVGYHQIKDKPIQAIREGDVIKIPAGVEHWHGASHSSSMTHTAFVPNLDKGGAQWLGPVTDEEYNSYKADQ